MVPNFDIAHTAGVREYCEGAVARLSSRLGLCSRESGALKRHFFGSLEACAERIKNCLAEPYVPVIPEARALYDYLGNLIVSPDSRIVGASNLVRAYEMRRQGWNVLLVQNHTSGADMIAMEQLVARAGIGRTEDWSYMAGHVVNLYLIPMTLAGAFGRYQIFSVKYRSLGSCGTEQQMHEQNCRALHTLMERSRIGGQFLVVYPEGGRGEGRLLDGVPQTMKIPQIMADSPKGLVLVPTYISGATSILPVHRGHNEFNEVLEYTKRGAATLTVGEPVIWDNLKPCDRELETAMEGARKRSIALNQCYIRKVMQLIADLAPTDNERGSYAKGC